MIVGAPREQQDATQRRRPTKMTAARPKAGHNGHRLRPLSLRSSSAPAYRAVRLPEIRFEGLVGLIPPLSYSLPQRTGRVFNWTALARHR